MALFIKILIFFLCYFTSRNVISDLKIFYLFSQRKTKHFAISAFKGSEISSSLKAASGTNPFNLAKCVLCSSLNVTENSSSFFHLKKWNDKPRTSTYLKLIRGKPILIAYFLLLQFIPTRFLESYTRKIRQWECFMMKRLFAGAEFRNPDSSLDPTESHHFCRIPLNFSGSQPSFLENREYDVYVLLHKDMIMLQKT